MQILLINGYSTKNRGDFGIILTTIETLRKKFSGCHIYIEKNYDDMIEYEKFGATLVDPIVANDHTGIMKYFSLLFSLFKNVKKYDLVISVGGGYLYSSKRGICGYGLMRVSTSIYLHSKFSKTFIYPQTAGPLRKVDSIIVSKLLSKIKIFYARDEESFQWCKKNKITTILTNDTVFLKAKNKEVICKPEPKVVGITLIDHSFTDNENTVKSEREIYLDTLSKYINNKFEKCNIYIQVDRSGVDTDKFVSEELAKRLNIDFSLINVSTSELDDIINLYSENDLFIASRMHSAIFALCSGVETIGIAYQPKTMGMFKLLGIPEYSIPLSKIDERYLNNVYKNNRGNKLSLNINIWEVL